jgi:uncharacterized protein YjbI with pentapeptide repeats
MDQNNEFDIFLYLLDCIEQNKSNDWNTFRRRNRKLSINFDHKVLTSIELTGFNFRKISFCDANFSESVFKNCVFDSCQIDKVQAFGATFEECSMVQTTLTDGNFVTTRFNHCDLRYANFSKSKIHQSYMAHTQADYANFLHVSFYDTCLTGSSFTYSDFFGCDMKNVQMYDTDFSAISVDGETIFWDCYYDRKTNFTGVGLSSCRIEPVLLSSFQCNIRRIWWENWYEEKKLATADYIKTFKHNPIVNFFKLLKSLGNSIINPVVKFFWWITDYGSSTIRLILVFLATTLGFALIYTIFPHFTNDLVINQSSNHFLVLIRSFYFSVIVMTGLGFGEINANPTSYIGHIVILVQSLMGYILLGAFLVRIGILFQGEFPVSSIRKKNCNTECDIDSNRSINQNDRV